MNSCMTWRALSMSPTAAFTTCDTPSIVMPDFENASSKPLRVSKMFAQSVRQRRADSLALLDDRLRQLLRLVIDSLHVARPRLIDPDSRRDCCGGADHGDVEPA